MAVATVEIRSGLQAAFRARPEDKPPHCPAGLRFSGERSANASRSGPVCHFFPIKIPVHFSLVG